MTLKTVKEQAYTAGYQDAIRGRPYRDSFNPGSHLRDLGLHAEYEAGWNAGRNQ